ncbi:MAG: S8 family serine peptidase [Bacteroidota bacterium]|nr:S8 family serine peptidase [Bacteroidota bacterium]
MNNIFKYLLIFYLFICFQIKAQQIEFVSGQLLFKLDDSEKTVIPEYKFSKSRRIELPTNPLLSSLTGLYVKYSVSSLKKAFKSKQLFNVYLIEFEDTAGTKNFIKDLQKIPGIQYAERIPIYKSNFIPNDIHPNQWYINKVSLPQAWDITRGVTTVTIAIVDDGVKITHEDLSSNIWVNPNEIPNNGVDDDNNGYIDDINGYDVADNDNDPNANNPLSTHGTHCSGIASAVTNNNKGVAGAGYSCRIIAVKCKQDAATGSGLPYVYNGLDYALTVDPDIISMSWGSYYYSNTAQLMFNLLHNNGVVLIASAGNDNTNVPSYPAGYNYVISVGASDQNDVRTYFSNYGSTIDIMAPGLNIYNTVATNNSSYNFLSGTSMAGPLVAGVAALMKSYVPSATPNFIENCLKSGADNIDNLNPNYIGQLGSGRLNAVKSLNCLVGIPTADFTTSITSVCIGQAIQLRDLSYGYSITGWNWTISGPNLVTSNLQNPIITLNTAGIYSVTLRVSNSQGSNTKTISNYILVRNPSATISGNNLIYVGQSSFIRLDFSGSPPFKVVYSDGTVQNTLTGINQNPFYYFLTPSTTTSYNLVSFSDNNCAGSIQGSALISVTSAPIPPVITVPGTTLPGSTFTGTSGFYSVKYSSNELVYINLNGQVNVIGNLSIPVSAKYRGMDMDSNGNLYLLIGNVLIKINKTDASVLETRTISGSISGPAITFSNQGELYVNNEAVAGPEGQLFKYNFNTQNFAPVSANTTGMASILAIEFDKNGTLWALDECCLNKLGTINSVTGIYSTSFSNASNSSFPTELDYFQNTLFGININDETVSNTTRLFKCNTSNGLTQTLFTLSGLYVGLASETNQNSSLIAHYPFCGNANDVSGNGLNGTIVGIVTLIGDRFGQNNNAYDFNGTSNDYIKIYNYGSLIPTNKLTCSFWVKRSRINVKEVLFLANNTGGWGVYFSDASEGFNNQLRFTKVDINAVNSSYTVADLNWHHCAVVYSGSQATFYLDGVRYNTSVYNANFSSSNYFSFGERFQNITNPYNGIMDDLKIFNTTLTDLEISNLYNETAYCQQSSLVAHYPFCGNANDVSGNGYHGTIAGATLAPDRFGSLNSAMSFLGGNVHIKIPRQISTEFSISAWFNTTYTYINQINWINGGSIVDAETWGCVRDFGVSIISGGKVAFGVGNDADCFPSSVISVNNYNDGNWHHILVNRNYQNGALSLYIDNLFVGSITSYINILNSPNFIGIGRNTGNIENNSALYSFIGKIDDIKIFNKNLSSTEISSLFNEGSYCPTTCNITTTSIIGSQTVCNYKIATYSVTGIPSNTYTWSISGIGIVGTGNSINYTFTSTGIYTILVTPSNSCVTPATKQISVSCCPQNTTIIGPNAICSGSTSSFSVIPITGVSYSWSIAGVGIVGSGNVLLYTFNNVGVTQIIAIPNSFCVNSAIYATTVTCCTAATPINASFTLPNSICGYASFNPINQSTGPSNMSYYWFFGNDAVPVSSTLPNPTNIYFKSFGNKSIYLTLTGACNVVDTAIRTLMIYPVPIADAGADINVCSFYNATLGSDIVISTYDYAWSPAQYLSNANVPNPILIAPYNGKFVLTVTSNDFPVCPAIDEVNVLQSPLLSITKNPICKGESTFIIGSMPGSNVFNWQPSSKIKNNYGSFIEVSPSENTTYTATATGQSGCVSNSSITVQVIDPYIIRMSTLTGIPCLNTSVGFNILNPQNNIQYFWAVTNKKSYFSTTTSVNFNLNGVSSLFIIDSSVCKNKSQTIIIPVDSSIITFYQPIVSEYCKEVVLTINSNFSTNKYVWSTSEATNNITVSKSGKYFVKTYNNCVFKSDTIDVKITYLDNKFQNVITPNGDGINDQFVIEGCINIVGEINLKIFNRWGTIVYESNNYKNNWNGENLPDGVYFYSILENKTGLSNKGWIQIIR